MNLINQLKNFLKTYQLRIILLVGCLLIASTAFVAGLLFAEKSSPPEIKVEEVFSYTNNTSILTPAQSQKNTQTDQKLGSNTNDCLGKIKGNINSKGEHVYHIPTGAFYDRTIAEVCFDTEQEARDAGFRKSSK